MANSSLKWPDGRGAALSLTFDDARPSQLDHALPVLDKHGVKGSFYVSLDALGARRDDWVRAARFGHEIGNHSQSHPCSINFEWVHRPLEEMTLADIEQELVEANRRIEQLVGVHAETYAYPCGQSFVGRGSEKASYVPVVARHFQVGRGFNGEVDNDPLRCDLAEVTSMDLDGTELDALQPVLRATLEKGRWLVLTGHEVGIHLGRQVTSAAVLDRVCSLARDGFWIAPVSEVGAHIRRHRSNAVT